MIPFIVNESISGSLVATTAKILEKSGKKVS